MAKVRLQFPNIYRSFTERLKKKKNQKLLKQIKFQNILTLYILTAALILILSFDILVSLQKQKEVNLERTKIQSEIKLWEELAQKYPNYKDAYFQLAVLEYKLGNIDSAKFYINKALYLDPNFEKAKSFQDTLKAY